MPPLNVPWTPNQVVFAAITQLTPGHGVDHLLKAFARIVPIRPAVASNLGEQAEVIEDGRHGLLVPPGDEGALAAALLRRYSADACARRLTDLYERLIAAPFREPALAAAR